MGLLAAVTSLSLLVAGVAAAAPVETGPTSSQSPYLVPVVDGASATSLLTVGDVVGGYKMVGIPDGMGTYDNGDGTYSVLVNHEINNLQGTVRAHGAIGSFVSKWTINKTTNAVTRGEDLMKRVMIGDGATGAFTPGTAVAFSRFCSADLPAQSAFFNAASGKGTQNKIFLNGEESGDEGRAVAHVVEGPAAGTSYVLPWLGKFSWENAVANPETGDKTVVIGTDDSTPGQVYVYIGDKRSSGNDVEKAGLVGGKLYGVKVDGIGAVPNNETDTRSVPSGGAGFSLVEIPNAATSTGVAIDTASDSLGVTEFARPEDTAWDPTNPKAFYMATTASFTAISRLWHLEFANLANPLAGGRATVAVNGPAFDAANVQGPRMMDNLTVTSNGNVLLQEDPGNQEYIAGIFEFNPRTKSVTRIFRHDPDRYRTGAPAFKTLDEESSGIIPAPFLGPNVYLANVQSHNATTDPETVQDGQLLVLKLGVISGISAAAGDITSGQAGLVNVTASSTNATGTVRILNGTTVLGTGTLTGGKTSVALLANSLPVGQNTLTVEFLGDASNAPSSSTFSVRVVAAPPVAPAAVNSTTAVTLDVASVKVRKGVAVASVTVARTGGGTPTGIVTASVNGVSVGAADLSSGKATIPLGIQQSVGTKSVVVKYLGDAATTPSASAPATLTVTKQTTRLKVAKPLKAGKAWKFAVTAIGETSTPSGKVKVKIKKKIFTGKLIGGTSLVKVKGLKPGTYRAKVSYPGDALTGAAKKVRKFTVRR